MGAIWVKQNDQWQKVGSSGGQCREPFVNGSLTLTRSSGFFTVPGSICVLKVLLEGGRGTKGGSEVYGDTPESQPGGLLEFTFSVKPGEQYFIQQCVGGRGSQAYNYGQDNKLGYTGYGGDAYAFGPWTGVPLTQQTVWAIAGGSGGGSPSSNPSQTFGTAGGQTLSTGEANFKGTSSPFGELRWAGGAGYWGGGRASTGAGSGGSSYISIPSERFPKVLRQIAGGASSNLNSITITY